VDRVRLGYLQQDKKEICNGEVTLGKVPKSYSQNHIIAIEKKERKKGLQDTGTKSIPSKEGRKYS